MVKTILLNSSNVIENTNNTKYSYRFPNSFQLNKGDKISLAQLTLPYSWFNINSALYSNNTLQIIYNGQTTNIVFPDGSYSVDALNQYIHQTILLSTNNLPYSTTGSGATLTYNYFINFSTNETYYSIDLIINPAILGSSSNPKGATFTGFCPQVNINSNISNIIGFKQASYPTITNRTTDFLTRSIDMKLIPNLSPVNSLIVLCSLAFNNVSGSSTNILYTISSNGTSFGNNIYLNLPQYQYVDTIAGSYQSLEITFVDQNFNRMMLNDYNVLISLIIKSVDE